MNTLTRWLGFAGLAALTIVLYSSSLHYAPFFDDFLYFERGGLDRVFLEGFAFEIRWLPHFSMAWINLIFDDRIYAQRIASLLFHLLTAYVLYALIKQVSQHAVPHRNNERAAFAAALLFALHPLAVYASGYMIQRTIVMATLFGLLSLSAYFDGCVARKKSYFIFSALFYLLSAFSKEHAVLIPAAALALTPLAMPLRRENIKNLWLPIVLFTLISLLVVYRNSYIIGQTYEPFAPDLLNEHLGLAADQSHWLLSVLTQAMLFFRYLGLVLIPNPEWMSIDIRVAFARSLSDPLYLMGTLAFLIHGGAALYLLLQRGRRGLFGYALFSPWLLFLVEFSAVRIQEPFVLYRTYLWMVPVFFLIPALTHKLSGKVFWIGLACASLALGLAARDRLDSFSSEFSLWDDAVRKLPSSEALGAARPYFNRGNVYLKQGDFPNAIADFTQTLRVNPSHRKAMLNLALANLNAEKIDEAMRVVNQAISLDPKKGNGLVVRGKIYQAKGDLEQALADFENACAMKYPAGCILGGLMRGSVKPKEGMPEVASQAIPSQRQ